MPPEERSPDRQGTARSWRYPTLTRPEPEPSSLRWLLALAAVVCLALLVFAGAIGASTIR